MNKTLKFVFIDEQTSERIKFLKSEMYFFKKNNLIKQKKCTSDYFGVVIADSLNIDSVWINFKPEYEYCSFKYPKQQSIKLKKIGFEDTLFLKVSFDESLLKNNFLFVFKPYGLDCISNFNDNEIKNKPCYCFYNIECRFLSTAIELLKCNQNLIVEIVGNCTNDEFKIYKDSLVNERIQIVRSIFTKNGIDDSRIKIVNYGLSKPRIGFEKYKLAKSKAELDQFEFSNTYVGMFIKTRNSK